jgi:hypothetical protein
MLAFRIRINYGTRQVNDDMSESSSDSSREPTPEPTQQPADWAARWKAANQKVRCRKCHEEDQIFRCIKCSECDAFFHKACINPIRTEAQWDEDAGNLVCDACADKCMVCGEEAETEEDPFLMCDNCEDLWHWDCLADDEQCPEEEVGDEDAEWYCPVCVDEYGSDMEWAAEHEVADDVECFTRSECTLPGCVCTEMNNAVDTWDTFEPENMFQRGLKDAIDAKEEGMVNHVMDELHSRHSVPPPRK